MRKLAWRTWLYFERFSVQQNHGLVPDNVQQEPEGQGLREALRISPTNAGMQLNARQAAVVLGYLSMPEYAEQTLANLRTLDQIPKWKGHLLNWYTTDTLEPIAPYIASTVDSGNFLASLCSLRMGTLEFLKTPMLPALRNGLLDIVNDFEAHSAFGAKIKAALKIDDEEDSPEWLYALLALEPRASSDREHAAEARLHAITTLVRLYLPWLQPKFAKVAGLAEIPSDRTIDFYTPENSLAACQEIRASLAKLTDASAGTDIDLVNELAGVLGFAEERLHGLVADLKVIAGVCERMFLATDYRVLLDPYRRLLTIGYDTGRDRPLDSCYDLLASEARTAMFIAIAQRGCAAGNVVQSGTQNDAHRRQSDVAVLDRHDV